jgi:hypothetical protein
MIHILNFKHERTDIYTNVLKTVLNFINDTEWYEKISFIHWTSRQQGSLFESYSVHEFEIIYSWPKPLEIRVIKWRWDGTWSWIFLNEKLVWHKRKDTIRILSYVFKSVETELNKLWITLSLKSIWQWINTYYIHYSNELELVVSDPRQQDWGDSQSITYYENIITTNKGNCIYESRYDIRII